MGTFPTFFTNLYNMTFKDRGGFWVIIGVILIIVLVYMFSPKLRKALGKKHHLLVIIPILLVGFGVYSIIHANLPAPAADQSGEPAAHDRTFQAAKPGKNSVAVDYYLDVTDPETGEDRVEEFKKIKALDMLSADTERTEDYKITSKSETAEIVFHTDGTYYFHTLDADGEAYEDTGKYVFEDSILTLYRDRKGTTKDATSSDVFWQNMSSWFGKNLAWFILGCVAILALIMAYAFNSTIRAFLRKHPLVWLIIPAFLLIYFVYVAIGWNIWVSVSDWEDGAILPSYGWGGFGQYAKMFDETNGPVFWNAVKNTLLLFTIIPICLLLGLGIALVMDHGLRGTSVFRTLILLPFALSFVVTGVIWVQMYRGDGGIIKSFFAMFGVDTSGILWTNSELIMVSIMIVMVWQFSGYVAVIFLAAIKNVPTNIINAAKLDGAYMPRVYWKIVIPQLKGALSSCITILAMYALRSFDLVYAMVGDKFNPARTLPVLMYYEGFTADHYAYAAAIGCFLLALVLLLILPLNYFTNRRK